jgi:glycosyl-4,4'-diaponeurosporenoate acyltransferase
MPTLHPFWIILFDILAWLIIHLGTAWLTVRMPNRWFDRDTGLYRIRAWEKNGRFWQRTLRVRSWKDRLPDGAALMRRGYPKKRLADLSPENLTVFIRETRRAELTHLLALAPVGLFFLWNPPLAAWINVLYALVLNVPCLIAQRFNRPRLMRALGQPRQ